MTAESLTHDANTKLSSVASIWHSKDIPEYRVSACCTLCVGEKMPLRTAGLRPEGIGASQYGIGMVCARITEAVLRDERAVIPIGFYNPKYGVTLSLPSVVGAEGVAQVLEPEMSVVEQ